jgi:hypothetical protein
MEKNMDENRDQMENKMDANGIRWMNKIIWKKDG